MVRLRIFAAAFLLTLSAAFARPWPVVDSDLPFDPAAVFGELPNGVRYIILPNAEPKNRISLRLLIAAGSLHERDDECGLAHFVEHMVFRGTCKHPGDSLAKELARRGIGFGPDNTAFTGHNYTVYHLELPDATDATLGFGLSVFREYASEVTFDKTLIERERGVILSEKATRDTPPARLGNAQLKFLFPTAREVRRNPIGIDTTILSATKRQLTAFYDAWYRPERIALVVVGNVTPTVAVKLITESFAALKARAAAREEPADLLTATALPPTLDGFLDNGLIGAEFSLQHAVPDPRGRDTRERRTIGVHRALGLAIMQRRLSRIAYGPDASFVAPTAALYAPIPGWLLTRLTVSGRIDTWKTYAAALEQEHRRAYLHGFTADEVASARAALMIGYEQAARSAATRSSEQLAAELEGALLYGLAFTTPEARRADLAPALAAATPEDCTRAFRALWSSKAPHVFVGSNPLLQISREDIANVLNASRGIAVAPPSAQTPVTFAYTDFGPPGTLVRDEYLADLEVHLAEFANGVRLNFKPTSFDADLVRLRLRVGSGLISQPIGLPGLDLLATHVVAGGGLRRHSLDELREILSGHAIQFTFEITGDACVFNAQCARAELPLCLQLITAYLEDAAYRPEALRDAHANFGSMYANLAASALGPIFFRTERTLVPDDLRLGYPESTQLFDRTIDEVSRWLKPQFKHGPIEFSLVGDIAWADAWPIAARTLGALAQRESHDSVPAPIAVTFAKPAASPYLVPGNAQLAQAAVAWFWPVPDAGEIHQERRCRFLAEALTERLRIRLREELGAAYAPDADLVQRDGMPSFSYLRLSAEVSKNQITRAAEVIRREIDTLRKRGLSEDEFLRVRQPFLRSRQDDLRQNSYWAYTVLDDAQRHPERIAAARDRATDTAAITLSEINALLQRYLDPARAFMFISEPGLMHLWGAK